MTAPIHFSTANKAKAQAIFTKVLRGLRKQGKAAKTGSSCKYKTRGGLACAIGILAGEDREPKWEGYTLDDYDFYDDGAQNDNPVKTWFLTKYGPSPGLLKLGIVLQNAHDGVLSVMSVSDWEETMQGIAKDFGLKYTAPPRRRT